MKKLLYSATLLLSHYVLFAQDYNCFTSTRQYFINGDSYLRGMRIDSVKTVGINTVYYPFHTPRGTYIDSSGNSVPLDTNGASWFGAAVTQHTGGSFFFNTIWDDTIIIKTAANPGDNWIFYNDTTNRYYTATVSAVDTMSFAGKFDSVKIITLISLSDTGIVKNDSLNNAQIILSKNYGFVQVFDLYTFPYHKPNSYYTHGFDYFLDAFAPYPEKAKMFFKQVNFYNPTGFDIYDYQPGDMFEYIGDGNLAPFAPNGHSVTLDSIISINPVGLDSLYYIAEQRSQSIIYSSPPIKNYSDVPNGIIPVSKLKLIDTSKMSEETGVLYNYYYNPGDTSHCFVSAIYSLSDNMIKGGIVKLFEPCSSGSAYKIGVGKVGFSKCDVTAKISYTEYLAADKKNGTQCEYFQPLVVPNILTASIQANIFPNPATDNLYIKLESTDNLSYTTRLINTLGQQLYQSKTNNSQQTINVSNFQPGIYNMQLRDDNGNTLNKKITIAH